ncbi:MAG TPA: GspH/FimT family protein [Thermohalobaculum sp.]|nr:GspH/FimT family protein [Thermohalobaculum sp.]
MPTSSAGRARRQRGLTLVELLVVLAVIAMVAVLAAPRFGSLAPGFALRESAEALRGDLRLTRNTAVRENRETVLVIDTDTGTWSAGARAGALPDGTAVELVAARQEQADAARAGIRFHPDGTSTGGTVTLAGEARTLVVSVDWFDGHVEILEPDGD